MRREQELKKMIERVQEQIAEREHRIDVERKAMALLIHYEKELDTQLKELMDDENVDG